MESFLKIITAETRERVRRSKARLPVSKIEEVIKSSENNASPIDFAGTVFDKKNSTLPAIIAESKKASPSHGVIRPLYSVKEIVSSYVKAGAKAISVLTEENHFEGDIYHLLEAREAAAPSIPILRKDFIIDEYQIYESRYYGADAVLLIKAIIPDDEFHQLSYAANNNAGLQILAEVRDEKELRWILDSKIKCVVGVNSRNLDDLTVNQDRALALISLIPDDIPVVAESGIKSSADILRVLKIRKNNIAFLIGTAFLTHLDPGVPLREIISEVSASV